MVLGAQVVGLHWTPLVSFQLRKPSRFSTNGAFLVLPIGGGCAVGAVACKPLSRGGATNNQKGGVDSKHNSHPILFKWFNHERGFDPHINIPVLPLRRIRDYSNNPDCTLV